jgi:hypothetical protein
MLYTDGCKREINEMPQARLRATFMRGGTSKALMLHRADLPADRADWAPIFLAAMGSPDPNGRQLDGMGGGVSSLSASSASPAGPMPTWTTPLPRCP